MSRYRGPTRELATYSKGPCRQCAAPMVSGWIRAGDRPGYAAHVSDGLCIACYRRRLYTGDEKPTRRPRSQWMRGADVLAELNAIGFDPRLPLAPQFREYAPRIGMTAYGLEKAWRRGQKKAAST